MDDFTRTTWLYLLKYKSQCVTFLQNFLLYVENQFHDHVKKIHSDNAKELCEGHVTIISCQGHSSSKELHPNTPTKRGG